MTDENLLMEAIGRSGIKVSKICEVCGFSQATFINKRKGRGNSEFLASEIIKISALLNLGDYERDRIFFAQNVD